MITACDVHLFGPDPDCDECWGVERCENCDLPTGACVLIGCKAPNEPPEHVAADGSDSVRASDESRTQP